MAKHNRQTLKNHFAPGSLPKATNFEDLVDSTLNMTDDGFSRSPENGVEIALVGEQNRRLMSFFGVPGADAPDWWIHCEPGNSNLSFASPRKTEADKGGEPHVLTMTPEGLDVNGVVTSVGRFGKSGLVPADGEWKDITEHWLEGCQAFEVMAGVGLEGLKKGRYALLHAFALNTFNPKRRWFNFLLRKKSIQCHHAWYLSKGDRLQLRWLNEDEPKSGGASESRRYKLQIKTVTSYEDGFNIQFSITQLWFDNFMDKSKPNSTTGK
jgi:hypothetical protein